MEIYMKKLIKRHKKHYLQIFKVRMAKVFLKVDQFSGIPLLHFNNFR